MTAFDELYLHYYKILCTSAFFYVKNEQEAKDLVQTLFLDIWEKQLYRHFHEDIRGYLFRAVKNRCINHLKWQKVQDRRQQGYAALQELAGTSPVEDPPDGCQQLQLALDDMAGQKRMAIQLVYVHGKRYQEAANDMRISINSLKTHLKTGLKFLRGEIKSKIN